MIRGKFVILFVFTLGVAAALFAIWYNHRLTSRALAFLGPEVAPLVTRARQVELLRFSGTDGSGDWLSVDNLRLKIDARRDISDAPGLIHARHALRQNASYIWDVPAEHVEPRWDCALRFVRPPDAAVLVFDFTSGRALVLQNGNMATMGGKLAEGLQRYLEELLPDELEKESRAGIISNDGP